MLCHDATVTRTCGTGTTRARALAHAQVRVASAVGGGGTDAIGELCRKHHFEGKSFTVVRGDYGPLMGRVVKWLEEAIPHAASTTQADMLRRCATYQNWKSRTPPARPRPICSAGAYAIYNIYI